MRSDGVFLWSVQGAPGFEKTDVSARRFAFSTLEFTAYSRDGRFHAQSTVGLPGTNFKRFVVNKTELIEHIANQADLSKAAAGRALEATMGAVRATLKKGGTVSLVGFGTFAVGKRAARTGRNPRTGAAIKIKSAKIPKFRPGKALKDALN
jgi:DNA-binding protein HU-beta